MKNPGMLGFLALPILSFGLVSAAGASEALGAMPHEVQRPAIHEDEAGEGPASQKAFGTSADSIVSMSGLAFGGYNATNDALVEGTGGWRFCSGGCELVDDLELPTGAEITEMRVRYRDAGAGGAVQPQLLNCPVNADFCSLLLSLTSVDGVDGSMSGSVNHTVDNLNNSYIVDVNISGGTGSYAFNSVQVVYKRQVSPAPGTATFGDVSTGHPFFQHVEALVDSGITAGCGGGNYCPNDAVTRGEMAVFLAAALGLHWPN